MSMFREPLLKFHFIQSDVQDYMYFFSCPDEPKHYLILKLIKISLSDLCGYIIIRFTASAFRKLPSIYVFSYFPFGFEGRMWVLIVSVPDNCLSFYFSMHF